ncbi:MAG: hypothetical protein CBB60_009745 [Armatimonadetes bacterium Cent15-Ar3]|nr:MAG: hypothetical protein CBB60_009745 [Armatimonadetes bacterium Cent15-Ar3]
MSAPKFLVLPWILVGVFGTLWVTKGSPAVPEGRVLDDTPRIVQSLREIGFLQTAELNLSDAFQYGTQREPEGVVAAIPGMESLVRATTRNSVWVQANGKVTAGIDLSKATIRIDRDAVHVRLPRLQIQPAEVDLKLIDDKKGLFWKDDEILLKAIREARVRFNSSVQDLDIEKTAFASAQTSIRRLLSNVTAKRLIIE